MSGFFLCCGHFSRFSSYWITCCSTLLCFIIRGWVTVLGVFFYRSFDLLSIFSPKPTWSHPWLGFFVSSLQPQMLMGFCIPTQSGIELQVIHQSSARAITPWVVVTFAINASDVAVPGCFTLLDQVQFYVMLISLLAPYLAGKFYSLNGVWTDFGSLLNIDDNFQCSDNLFT